MFVIKTHRDGSFWKRRYDAWNGHEVELEQATRFKTRAGAEKRAEQLKAYERGVSRISRSDDIRVVELS